MSISMIIELLVQILRGFLFKSNKAAPYAKWLLRARDYLLLLFPIDMYPEGQTDDPALKAGLSVTPVSKADIKVAAKDNGFNLPFIKGK